MLSKMELQNFKAFGQRVGIPLAPITLIFGENSSGKSSILQSVYLLKQSMENRDEGSTLLPRLDKGLVDLGSYGDFIYNHELERNLKIRIGFSGMRGTANEIGLEFERISETNEIKLCRMSLFGDSSLIVSFVRTKDRMSTNTLRNFPYIGVGLSRARANKISIFKLENINTSHPSWISLYNQVKKNRVKITRHIGYVLADETSNEKEDDRKSYDYRLIRELLMYQRAFSDDYLLTKWMEFLEEDFSVEEFNDFILKGPETVNLLVDGFLPVTSDVNMKTFFSTQTHISQMANLLSRELKDNLEELTPMGPIRKQPQRWYIFGGSIPDGVGYFGDFMPDILFSKPEILDRVNYWLERLDIGYRMVIEPLGDKTRDIYEVRLTDTRNVSNVTVGLMDVGYGVSQILPFIVQSVASHNKIITIEQPEVHIHPKLQANIGDLLVDATKEPSNNQIIVETHSEHLVLRLQKLVRNGLLNPEMISILYVQRGYSNEQVNNGARVTQLRLNDRGEFLDDWPGGFFPERLNEIFD